MIPNLAKTAIQETSSKYWKAIEQQRVKDAQKMYYWYHNYKDEITNYIIEAMNKMFKASTIETMNIRVKNVVPRIVDKLALVYKDHPERVLDGGKQSQVNESGEVTDKETPDNEKYQELLMASTIEQREGEWEKMAKYFNTILVQPVWKVDHFDFIIHTPAWCIVETDPADYTKASSFYYPIWKQLPGKEEQEQVLVYWSATEHYYMDADETRYAPDNNVAMKNPYGILPAATLRIKLSNDFWGEGMWDVVDGNEEVCIQTTNIYYTAIFQAHGQPLGINLGKKASELQIGPDKPILVDNVMEGQVVPDLKYVSANPMLQPVVDLIDWSLKTDQMLKGLSPQQYSLESSIASGVSKIIDSTEIQEIRRDLLKTLTPFEKDLFEIMRTIYNYESGQKIGEKAEFSIRFKEPKIVETTDEKIKKRAAGLEQGTMSRIDMIMEDNPNMTRDEAEDKLKLIIAENQRYKDEFGLFNQQERNQETINSLNETPEDEGEADSINLNNQIERD